MALSDCFLDNGDAVVCAVYNYEDHATEFQLIENREERDKAIGSKYMQSKPGKIYKTTEDWLINHPENDCFLSAWDVRPMVFASLRK